jgi:hypothetical protein
MILRNLNTSFSPMHRS